MLVCEKKKTSSEVYSRDTRLRVPESTQRIWVWASGCLNECRFIDRSAISSIQTLNTQINNFHLFGVINKVHSFLFFQEMSQSRVMALCEICLWSLLGIKEGFWICWICYQRLKEAGKARQRKWREGTERKRQEMIFTNTIKLFLYEIKDYYYLCDASVLPSHKKYWWIKFFASFKKHTG